MGGMNSAAHLRNKSGASKTAGVPDEADFILNHGKFALEFDETEMKSMNSMANQKNKFRLTGVPDLSVVRQSVDKLGKSRTDDRVAIGLSKVRKNPKLKTTQGRDIGALDSDDFDSEK
jgi:hypothetical protein